jgi:hypothetical protein
MAVGPLHTYIVNETLKGMAELSAPIIPTASLYSAFCPTDEV